MKTKRIFMNEADTSPGGGAVPVATPAPTAAPTAPETPPLTIDVVKNQVADQLKTFQNEFFANARKAGLLEKGKASGETPSAASTPTAVPAQTGLTEEVLEARFEQERVLTRVQLENKLTDAQLRRMKSAIKAEQPTDISSWTSTYLADMGLVRTEPSTTTTPSTPVVPSAAPISDRGSPAPNGAVGWRYELSNPIGMSAAARAQMDAELGADKARKMRLEAAQAQAAQMRVVFGPKG